MIHALLSLRFVLNKEEDTGDIRPEFQPIYLFFKDKTYAKEGYEDLITRRDTFGILYQHTTGIFKKKGAFSNFTMSRLKETPYQVISFYRQEVDKSQFLTIGIFDLDDELEIYLDIIKTMANKLETLYLEYLKLTNLKQLTKVGKTVEEIEKELKFAVFQIDRLAKLEKMQKIALIFQSDERLKILELLRERPISKRELKDTLEKMKPNPNVDLLIEPFLELNLIRRDWIIGDKKQKRIDDPYKQGEFIFLVKDIELVRLPNKEIITIIKEKAPDMYDDYESKIMEYFNDYKINNQTKDDAKILASTLLIPDCYDFYRLMKENYYPLEKLPKIFSEFVDSEFVIDRLDYLKMITKVKGKKGKEWVVLFADVVPLVIFPEFLYNRIMEAFETKDKSKKISYEVAKKALDLLELTYPEHIEI